MNKPFADRIAAMNAMYKLPAHESPTLTENVADRLTRFKATLLDEVHEIDEIVAAVRKGAAPADVAVAIADVLTSGVTVGRLNGRLRAALTEYKASIDAYVSLSRTGIATAETIGSQLQKAAEQLEAEEPAPERQAGQPGDIACQMPGSAEVAHSAIIAARANILAPTRSQLRRSVLDVVSAASRT